MSSLIFPVTPGTVRVRRTLLARTETSEADDGKEFRVGKYPLSRYRYEVEWRFLRTSAVYAEAQRIWRHFVMHGGRRDSFLFEDPDDNAVVDHGFGVGDGVKVKFPLQRSPGGDWQDALGTWPTYTKPRTNYCLQSQTFESATWTKRATHAITGTNTAIAPDGTQTAEQVTATAGTGNQGVYQDIVAFNAQWVVSIWLRSGTLAVGKLCVKDRATDTVRATVDVTMTATWQRFTVTGTTSGGSAGLRFEWNGVGTGTFFTWGAQAESAAEVTRYVATVAAAVREDPAYWTVNESTGALIAPGASDGTEPVAEPRWDTVSIYRAGVLQSFPTDWTMSANAVVTFAGAAATGAALSWTGSYYRRVRFDDDELDLERIVNDVKSGSIELVSVV